MLLVVSSHRLVQYDGLRGFLLLVVWLVELLHSRRFGISDEFVWRLSSSSDAMLVGNTREAALLVEMVLDGYPFYIFVSVGWNISILAGKFKSYFDPSSDSPLGVVLGSFFVSRHVMR